MSRHSVYIAFFRRGSSAMSQHSPARTPEGPMLKLLTALIAILSRPLFFGHTILF